MSEIFEDDLFEEDDDVDESPPTEVSCDDDTQHIIDLMNKSLSLFQQAASNFDNIIEINKTIGAENTGIPIESLITMKLVFEEMLPDLILGNKEDYMLNMATDVLGSEKLAKTYLEEKRLAILERIDD